DSIRASILFSYQKVTRWLFGRRKTSLFDVNQREQATKVTDQLRMSNSDQKSEKKFAPGFTANFDFFTNVLFIHKVRDKSLG
uniref:Uncharacterized protein n=1 Tax=Romanomermis culicivorax TaxID=13658 RepID=A0A915JNR9_ROMCU